MDAPVSTGSQPPAEVANRLLRVRYPADVVQIPDGGVTGKPGLEEVKGSAEESRIVRDFQQCLYGHQSYAGTSHVTNMDQGAD
jgi:hypothetical protein